MKLIVAALLMAAPFLAFAQDNWIPVSNSQYGEGFALKGSYVLTKNKVGEEIAVITGKTDVKATSTIDLEKWYVRVADCRRKQGKLVALTMDGEFKYDSDFVYGAGSVGSAKAEFVCGVYEYQRQEKADKGL